MKISPRKVQQKILKKNEQKDKLRMNPRNAFFMGGKKNKKQWYIQANAEGDVGGGGIGKNDQKKSNIIKYTERL